MTAIEYREFEGAVASPLLNQLASVAWQVFSEKGDLESFTKGFIERGATELNGYRWVHVGLAYKGDQIVGYKAARSNDPRTLESWNGGVLADARGQGIATELAARQEAWAKTNGFAYLMTIVAHDNQPMLRVNLKRGFCIVGHWIARGQYQKLILEKMIT